MELDDEIVQDFLVEAEESLEQLSENLVELEQEPDDKDLLNKVFRGFHNIKGGAGFLNLPPLVELCHRAEDVFNTLRQGERRVCSDLMDVVLQALDVVTAMVACVRSGDELAPADDELLARLKDYSVPEGAAPAATEPVAPSAPAAAEAAINPATPDAVDQEFDEIIAASRESRNAAAPESDEISDDEFEQLLDSLHGQAAPGAAAKSPAAGSVAASTPATVAPAPASDGDEITDDEFEKLLDNLHGPGAHVGVPRAASGTAAAAAGKPAAPAPPPGPVARGDDDEISDDEFEELLDSLHGKGRHTGAPKDAAGPASAPPAAAAKSVPAARKAAPAAAARPAAPAAAKPAAEPKAETTVRVDTKRLDDIMNMVGELVLVRNRFATLRESNRDERFVAAVSNLDVVTADLQLAVMKTRMQPIKKVFGRFPRLVRDLARTLNKELNLELSGEETDLDKNLVEALADPLVHLVRNAVDHGIETPDEREAAGKPRQATVTLSAEQEGDHIRLVVGDDGRGMDAEKFRRKVVEKGIMDSAEAARLSEQECYNLVFMPGFSTKQEISDVSGRGVGMDVVKTRIAQLNGAIDIETEPGRGTRFLLKVPLTLAIMPTLMVVVGERVFALPLLSIVEIIDYDARDTKTVDGQLVLLLRDKPLPVFHLRQWLLDGKSRHQPAQAGHVVIVALGAQRVGLVVDHLVGQEEVVIKPLGALLQGTPGLAGATITGSGRIALILDLPGLIKAYASRIGEVA